MPMQTVKAFDFDGTLFRKNALNLLIKVKFRYHNFFVFVLWLLKLVFSLPYIKYLYHKDCKQFNRYLYSHYQGVTKTLIEQLVAEKINTYLRDNIYFEGLKEMEDIPHCYIVSANLDLFLVPFFSKLGFSDSHIFCNRLEFDDAGSCTGQLVGDIVDGEQKARCLDKIRQHYEETIILISFGDSQWDMPMLQQSDYAYLVNPKQSLRKLAGKSDIQNLRCVKWSLCPFSHNILVYFLCSRIIPKFFTRKVYGNKINRGSVIIVSNHQSYLDHFVMSNVVKNDRYCFIGKQEHYEGLISRWFHGAIRSIPIAREDAELSKLSLFVAYCALKLGLNIIIYPEGTRTEGELIDFKGGFIKLSHMFSHIPIYCVTIHGTYQLLPKNCLIPRLKKAVDVNISQPICAGRSYQRQYIMDTVTNNIKNSLNTLQSPADKWKLK